MSEHLERREFFRQALLAGTAAWTAGSIIPSRLVLAARGPNEKLNLACVGVANKGADNINNLTSENIVALCDVDSLNLGKMTARFPQAKTYADFRQMLDQEKNLDGVVVSTPDHTHAVAVMAALKRGLDVYCEKPLAHSVYEVRQMRNEAAGQKAVTQMGTQIHAGENYRRVVEIIKAGQIGPVSARSRVDGQYESSRHPREGGHAAVDGRLRFVDWPGPDAAVSPFALSLQLALLVGFRRRHAGRLRLPLHGFAVLGARSALSDHRWKPRAKRHHRATTKCPTICRSIINFRRGAISRRCISPGITATGSPRGRRSTARVPPCCSRGPARAAGCWPTTARASCSCSTAPIPSRRRRPIPNSIGHWAEWAEACKSRGPTTCNFDYSGALAEAVLLGNVSYRAGGKKLTWDADSLKATNCPEADAFIKREYRAGWTL